MTKEQEQLVTNNHNLIYFIIKRLNLSIDEYYDIAAIGLCKAAMNYDVSKGYNFSTFATSIIINEIRQEMRRLSSLKWIPQEIIISIDEPIKSIEDGSLTVKDTLRSNKNIESDILTKLIFKDYVDTLKPLHRDILELRMNGHTQREIAQMLSITQSMVSRVLRQIAEYICN